MAASNGMSSGNPHSSSLSSFSLSLSVSLVSLFLSVSVFCLLYFFLDVAAPRPPSPGSAAPALPSSSSCSPLLPPSSPSPPPPRLVCAALAMCVPPPTHSSCVFWLYYTGPCSRLGRCGFPQVSVRAGQVRARGASPTSALWCCSVHSSGRLHWYCSFFSSPGVR